MGIHKWRAAKWDALRHDTDVSQGPRLIDEGQDGIGASGGGR